MDLMNPRVSLGIVVCWFLGLGCGSSVDDYCNKLADCSERSCNYKDDTCAALAVGERQSCKAERESRLNALLTGDSAYCTRCAEAAQKLMGCMASVNSCAAFRIADDREGACWAEAQRHDELCQDERRHCYE
jgi:hypothetical protein